MTTQANAPEIAEQVNDNPNPEPAAPQAAPEALEPSEKPAEQVQQPAAVDPRQAIAERFKRQRREEEGEPHEPDDFQTPPFLQRQPQEEEEAEDAPQTPQAKAPERQQDAQTFTLKVRKNEITLTREQLYKEAELEPEEAEGLPVSLVLKLAQKNMAANSYLDEARQAAKESRLSSRAGQHQPESDEEAGEDQGRKGPTIDPRIREAIEKIQYGDPDEAAAALAEAVNTVQQEQRARQIVPQHQREVAEAVDMLTRDFADVMADDELADMVVTRTLRELKTDLVRAGYPQDFVESRINTADDAANAYIAARLEGKSIRTPAEILTGVATKVRERFLGAAPAPTPQPSRQPVQDRTALKRALPPQPSRDNAQPVVPRPNAPQTKTRSDVVAQMRRARGQN